jgi:hypothetical protein
MVRAPSITAIAIEPVIITAYPINEIVGEFAALLQEVKLVITINLVGVFRSDQGVFNAWCRRSS